MGLRFEISFRGIVIICKLFNLLAASLVELQTIPVSTGFHVLWPLYLTVCHSMDVV